MSANIHQDGIEFRGEKRPKAIQKKKHPLNIVMKRLNHYLDKMIGYPEVIEILEMELDSIQKFCGMEKDHVTGDYYLSNEMKGLSDELESKETFITKLQTRTKTLETIIKSTDRIYVKKDNEAISLQKTVKELSETLNNFGDEAYSSTLKKWLKWKIIDGDLLLGDENILEMSFRKSNKGDD